MLSNPSQTLTALTIAGSDSSGGAGIQADLATFANFNVHGLSVITALTAQNPLGVHRVSPSSIEQITAELNAVELLNPAAIKIGMLANEEILKTVNSWLDQQSVPVICDPVMSATSGGSLLDNNGIADFKNLLNNITLLTPNIREAAILTGTNIATVEDIQLAADNLLAMGAGAVLITGGHFLEESDICLDYFKNAEQPYWLRGKRIATANNHGTGCTLSSAIAAALAHGYELIDAVVLGKMAVSQGLSQAQSIGDFTGAVAHPGGTCGIEFLPEILPANAHPLEYKTPAFSRCTTEPLGVYPVVDSAEWVEKCLAEGVPTVQLRVKDLPEDTLRELVKQSVAAQNKYGGQLFINDYWQLAIEYGAYGVHLGQEDLDTADIHQIANAGLRLGISNHAWYEIARAHAIKPSYMAIGPIYSTPTKVMRFAPQGLEQLQEWVGLLKPEYPMTAIGGINLERAPAVAKSGVGSIAVVRAITEAADYKAAIIELNNSLQVKL